MTLWMGVAGFLLLCVSSYVGGYLASCGWHQRKREFVRQMMSDHTEVTNGKERSATA